MKNSRVLCRGEKTFRLIITEDCNASCPHCFNADMRGGNHMPMDIFYRALTCINGPAVKIMGGEPTLHPHFLRMVHACRSSVQNLRVFTNGTQKEILDQVDWHPDDTVTYNFYVANRNLSNQNYLWNRNINRTFHVVVNTQTDFSTLFVKLRNLAQMLHQLPETVQKRSGVALSLDTQENIFHRKDELQGILYGVVRRLRLWGFRHISRDHQIPRCFWTRQDIRNYLDAHMKNNLITDCFSPNCAGWIGIDGTVRHCNQFPVYCGRLRDGTHGSDLHAWYMKARAVKLNLLREEPECRQCRHIETCLGGCFKAYHLSKDIRLHRIRCA